MPTIVKTVCLLGTICCSQFGICSSMILLCPVKTPKIKTRHVPLLEIILNKPQTFNCTFGNVFYEDCCIMGNFLYKECCILLNNFLYEDFCIVAIVFYEDCTGYFKTVALWVLF